MLSPRLMPNSPSTHQQMTRISSDGIVKGVAALCVVCEYMIVGNRRKLAVKTRAAEPQSVDTRICDCTDGRD